MSTTAVARACARSGARLVGAGALVLGLLATAPVAPAQAATPTVPAADTTASSAPTAARSAERSKAEQRRAARMVGRGLAIARGQQGDPYSYGSAGPGSFDCSGLMYYSFRRAGFSRIPRTSSAQAGFATRIRRENMRPGDFIFFTGSGGVYHVGLYAGMANGRRLILHAGTSGTRVRTEPVWGDNWFPGTLRF